MSSLPARRLGVLTTALLTVGLLAPTAVSAAPTGSAATFGQRESLFPADEEASMSALATSPIEVRDLSYACPSGVRSGGFTDVKGSPFAAAIDCLVWYEITQGKTETSYAPGDSVTRQQMAVFLHRMLDDLVILPAPPSKSQFRDVPATGEVGRAINVLASPELADLMGRQIVSGKTSTTFDPGGRVTRAQMGSFIARTLEGVFEVTGVPIHDRGSCDGVFSDERLIPADHWDNVELLCAAGIVTGRKDGTYGPGADVSRGQMAAFLMRLMDVFVEVEVPLLLRVDRGTGTTACTDTTRDGSSAEPFCTIQAGIKAAGAKKDRWVDVVVEPRDRPYVESIVLASGSASGVILSSPDLFEQVPVTGSIRITGDEASDENYVYGLAVTSPTTTTAAFDIRTPGYAELGAVVAAGSTAVRIDQQQGATGIWYSGIDGVATGIDMITTDLQDPEVGFGTWVYDTEFAPASAFVRAPGESAVIDDNLSVWMSAVDSGNTFSSTPQLVTVDGRRAITP